MPPRDLWDSNPVHQPSFYFTYCEWLAENPVLGILPSVLVDEGEVVTDDEEEEFDDEEDDGWYSSGDDYEQEEVDDEEEEEDGDEEGDDPFEELWRWLEAIDRRYAQGSASNPIDLTNEN